MHGSSANARFTSVFGTERVGQASKVTGLLRRAVVAFAGGERPMFRTVCLEAQNTPPSPIIKVGIEFNGI
jgi:hypothetical protein